MLLAISMVSSDKRNLYATSEHQWAIKRQSDHLPEMPSILVYLSCQYSSSILLHRYWASIWKNWSSRQSLNWSPWYILQFDQWIVIEFVILSLLNSYLWRIHMPCLSWMSLIHLQGLEPWLWERCAIVWLHRRLCGSEKGSMAPWNQWCRLGAYFEDIGLCLDQRWFSN